MLIIAKFQAKFVRLLFPLGLVVFMAACQPAGPKALLDGERQIREGDYRGALKSLKLAAELIPQNPQVWNHIGLAHHGMGNTVEAAQAYHRALTLDRNLWSVYFNLGNLYLEENKLPEATAALTSYTLLRPKDAEGWNKLAVAKLRAKKPDDAERSLVNGLKLAPKDPELHNHYGMVHLQRKRPREALYEFNQALQADPKYGPALLNQAIVAHHHLNNKQAALDRYKLYVGLTPTPDNAPEIRTVIAELQAELAPKPDPVILANIERATREAAAQTNAAIPPKAQPPVVAQPATNIAQVETNKPAVMSSAPVTTNKPAVAVVPPPATNKPVTIALATNKPPVTNIVVAPPAPSPTTQAVAAATPPKTNEAALATKPIPPQKESGPKVEEPPVEPIVTVAVAQEPVIKPVRDILPSAPPARPVETNVQVAQNTPEEKPLFAPRPKREEPKVLEKINPLSWFRDKEQQPAPRTDVARATPVNPPPRQAPPIQPTVPENVEISPTPAPEPPPVPRYPYRKNSQLTKGQTAEAEKLFQQGALLQEEKKYGGAIDFYRQAIAKDATFFQAYYNLGIVAYQLKDLPLALGANEQAVQLKPSSVDARYNFALTLRDANYPLDAANELRELLVEAPDEVRAHFMLANLYAQKLNQPILARRHYERVLALDPRHREAVNIRYWLASNR